MVDCLFRVEGMYEYLDVLKKEIKSTINNLPKNEVLNCNEKEYFESLISRFEIEHLRIDEQAIFVEDAGEGKRDVSQDSDRAIFDRSEPLYVKTTIAKIHIPFQGKKELWRISPSTWSGHTVKAEITDDELIITYEFLTDSVQEGHLQKEIDRDVDYIKQMIENQNAQINPFNEKTLIDQIQTSFVQRKEKLLKDDSHLKSLKYPLKRKEESKLLFRPPRVKRKITFKKIDDVKQVQEPKFDEEEYSYVVKVINSMGVALEQCSATVRDMKEEDLRLLFLVILNSHYENQATGETFNKEGKTDIIIKHKGRNIFVAECKIWKGKQNFLEGINQLLNNLCWRDTKSSLIVFVKEGNFTEIIKKAQEHTQSHPNCISLLTKSGESTFTYKFKQQVDLEREIFLTVHLFHVPKA